MDTHLALSASQPIIHADGSGSDEWVSGRGRAGWARSRPARAPGDNVSVSVQLNFRPAVADDADDLVRLVRSAYREADTGGWTTEAHLVADERIDAQQLRAKIAQPDTVVLCAHTEDDVLVACCELVGRDRGLAYFGMFAVSPALQAAGIGRRMLAAAEQAARERWGARRMEMTVIAQRDELIAWYQRRGYQPTGEQRPFPYEHLLNGVARRDDLYFVVLAKAL